MSEVRRLLDMRFGVSAAFKIDEERDEQRDLRQESSETWGPSGVPTIISAAGERASFRCVEVLHCSPFHRLRRAR
jgi:hypothetical protein